MTADGRVLRRSTYSEDEFNQQGDWIKRSVKTEEERGRKESLIETRKIEYHPVNN